MPDLSPVLIDSLRQFPMVVVIGLALWYAAKQVREKEIRLESRADELQKSVSEREDKLRKEARDDRDAEFRRHYESHQAVLEAKDDQIDGLTAEVERLRKEIAALTKKLSG